MAQKLYCDIDGAARRVKKLYCDINGVSRKVVKLYAEIGGVSKLVFVDDSTAQTTGERRAETPQTYQ